MKRRHHLAGGHGVSPDGARMKRRGKTEARRHPDGPVWRKGREREKVQTVVRKF